MKYLTAITVLLALAVVGQAVPQCHWGPSYWCQSEEVARQCSRVQYCQQNVWKSQSASVSGAVECDVCKFVIGLVDKYIIDNNATEADAEKVAEDICDLLGSLKTECKALISGNFDMIWKLLEEETSPDKICADIGACTSSMKSASVSGGIDCDLCKYLIGLVDKYIINNNATEAEAEKVAEGICDLLGSLKAECKARISDSFDLIWKLLEEETSPDTICAVIQVCTSSMKVPAKPKAMSAGECDICKVLVGMAVHYLETNKTEAEAESLVKEVCTYMGSFATECDDLVNEFFPQIWKYLEAEMDPATVCTELGLCTSTKKPKAALIDGCDICKIIVGIADHFLDANETEDVAEEVVKAVCTYLGGFAEECRSLVNSYFPVIWELLKEELDPQDICTKLGQCTSTKKKVPAMPEQAGCEICKLLVSFLKPFVDSNATEAEVDKAITDFCGVLPSPLKTECDALIKDYFPAIWALVENEFDDICKLLGLCPSAVHKKVPAMPEQPLCQVCELVVSFLKPFVDSNATEAEVENAIEGLCGLLPASVKSECDALIKDYFPAIWALVESEFDNDQICKVLGLCPSAVRKLPKVMPKQDLCQLCELLVNFVKPYIDSNATEAEAEQALDGLCKLLPNPLSDTCDKYLKQYFPTVWNLVKAEVDDDMICKQLGLCNSTIVALKSTRQPPVTFKLPKVMPKQDLCQLCELLVNFVKPYIDSNATEADAEQALDRLCKLLPKPYNDTCNTDLKKYFPEVWELLEAEVADDLICKQLGLCNSTTVALKSTRQHPVTFKVKGSLECKVCEMVVKFLKPFVNSSATEADVKKALEFVCLDVIKPFSANESAECMKFADDYLPLIWELLKQVDPSELCEMIKVCPSTVGQVQVTVKTPDSVECDVCKIVVSFLVHYIDNNGTEEEAKEAVEKVCSLLPETYASECKALVIVSFDMIWKYLMEGVDDVCVLIGVCTSVATPPKEEFPGLCFLCEEVMKELAKLITNKPTEEEISKALEMVCDVLPSELRSDCDDFIAKYTPDIINLLLDGVLPKAVCTILGLCVGKKSEATPPVGGAIDCDLCKFLLGELKGFVASNASQAEVEALLDKFCDIIPSALQDECTTFIKMYGPQVISEIVAMIDPEAICTKLGLCASAVREFPGLTFFKVPRRML